VGGGSVAVGIAARVCATIVNAAASAVFLISRGLTVGTAACPELQAVASRHNVMPKIKIFLFIYQTNSFIYFFSTVQTHVGRRKTLIPPIKKKKICVFLRSSAS